MNAHRMFVQCLWFPSLITCCCGCFGQKGFEGEKNTAPSQPEEVGNCNREQGQFLCPQETVASLSLQLQEKTHQAQQVSGRGLSWVLLALSSVAPGRLSRQVSSSHMPSQPCFLCEVPLEDPLGPCIGRSGRCLSCLLGGSTGQQRSAYLPQQSHVCFRGLRSSGRMLGYLCLFASVC